MRTLRSGRAGFERRRCRRDAEFVGRYDLAVFPDDPVVWRKAYRRIGMRVVLYSPEDAFVNFRNSDADLVVFLFPDFRIQEWHQFARPVAVIAAEAFARIVELSVLVPLRNRVLKGVGIGNHEVGI